MGHGTGTEGIVRWPHTKEEAAKPSQEINLLAVKIFALRYPILAAPVHVGFELYRHFPVRVSRRSV